MYGHPIYEPTEAIPTHDWSLYEDKALECWAAYNPTNPSSNLDKKDFLFSIIPSGEWRPRFVEMRAFRIHRQTACFFFIRDEKFKERRVHKLGNKTKYRRSAEGAYQAFVNFREAEHRYLMMRLHRCAMQARIMSPKCASTLEESFTTDVYSGRSFFGAERELWDE